jgi:autotransporter-associated beta strand protein
MVIGAGPASAAIRIWDGDGGPGNLQWMNSTNWVGDIAPVAGDALVFPSGTAAIIVNNFPAGTEFQSISFNDYYEVQGNRILIASTIQVKGNATVTMPANVTLKGAILGATIDVIVEAGSTLEFSGVIDSQQEATLRKLGGGRLWLSGANQFTSIVLVNEGMLRTSHAQALGITNHGTTVATGASLVLGISGDPTVGEPISLAGAGTPAPDDGALVIKENVVLTGTVTLAASPTIYVDPTKYVSFAGRVTGPTGFTKDGTGGMDFEGGTPNDFAGVTTLRAGSLTLTKSSDVTAIPAGLIVGDGDGNGMPFGDFLLTYQVNGIEGPISVSSSGTISIGTYAIEADSLSMNGGRISTGNFGKVTLNGDLTVDTSSAPATIEGNLSLGAAHRTISVTGPASAPLTVTATISGNAGVGFTKTGTGRLLLDAPNTYTGPTTVEQGGIVLAHAQALGATAAGTTLAASASLILYSDAIIDEPLVAEAHTAEFMIYCGIALCRWNGPIQFHGLTQLYVGGGSVMRLTGAMSSTGAGNFTTIGNGILELGGAGTYTGETRMSNGGTLRLLGSHLVPNGSIVNLGLGSTLDLNGFSDVVAGLKGAGTTKALLGGGTLTVAAPASFTTEFGGVMSGSGGLVKEGAGTFGLTGPQSYTGPTAVKAGTMTLNGTLASTVTVTGGTFAGTGAVNQLSATGGTIAPGNSPGVLAMQHLTLNSSSTLAIEINGGTPGTQHDQIEAAASVTLGNATLQLIASPELPIASLGTLTIVKVDGNQPVSGTFAGLPEGAVVSSNGKSFRISYAGGTGNDIVLTPAARDYYLSEGATGAFFDLDILIANPNAGPAPVTLTFLQPGGGTVVEHRIVPAMARITLRADDIAGLSDTAVSTVVTSDEGLPLVVERTMRWDHTGYGAHTEKAADSTALHWYFAEGSQGYFSTYLLLVNPQDAPNVASVQYLREGATPIVRTYDIPARSRFTVDAGADPDLVNMSFGMHVTFAAPGAAERAMYFGTDPLWKGGHESAGVTAPSQTWFLAEGATGPFFETFVLLGNPGDAPATATVTFLPLTGEPVTKTYNVPAFGRVTINIEVEDASLANAAVATQVTATAPILVERAQYWPDPFPTWHEAHNSFGVTATATKWGLAEGRVGGAEAYLTYILLANAESTETQATITFLRENGTPFSKTFTIAARSRFNIDTGPGTLVPELANESFGALIESQGPIAVERAMYANANGQVWGAGTNATATRLP